jgi:alpha-galactosidase
LRWLWRDRNSVHKIEVILLFFATLSAVSPQWTLATDDTVARIGVVHDLPVVERLASVSDAQPWCTDSPLPLIDHVWQGDRDIPLHWQFQSGMLADSKLILRFRSANPPLELRSIWRARKGRGPIEHWLEIENRTEAPITVPQQESLTLTNLAPGADAQIWWIRRGASNAMTQGGVFQSPVKPGLNLDLVSNNHDGASPVPWLAVQCGEARGLYLGWEFSGLGRLNASTSTDASLNLKAGLMPDFKTNIEPHETLTIPTAFVGCYRGDIDDGSNSLHKFVLEKLRPKPPKGFADPALAYNLYLDAGGTNAKEADVLRSARLCKEFGFEVFMPDAMWFPECGDWKWDTRRFPNGVRPIERFVHRSGMKMALWCAWDNGGISTDEGALSVRGPVGHPDWFSRTPAPDWKPGPFYGIPACMGDPEAKAWAIQKTNSIVAYQKLDYLKTDCDPMVVDCDKTDHRHSFGTDASYWSTLGVYDVWDNLRAHHPNLVLENCSGASHIKDFGVVKRCLYTVVTDTLSNLPDRAAIYDSTFVLPPSALMAYTYERAYGQKGDDPAPYFWRSAMMVSWQIDPTNTAIWTTEEKASVRAAVKTYKEWIRPILRDCAVHHVLPRPDGKHWDGMFFWSDSLDKGSLFVFRPDSGEERHTVRLAGLDRAKTYLVWSDDGSIQSGNRSGAELMDAGIPIKLQGRFTSDLIRLQSVAKG